MHVNFIQQYSGYVYFVTIATVVTHHRQTTISLTFPNFPDIFQTNVNLFQVLQVGGHPAKRKNGLIKYKTNACKN